MLACMGVARRGGYWSDRVIADGGRCDGPQRVRALGVTRDQPPGAATLPHVLRQRDGALVEAALGGPGPHRAPPGRRRVGGQCPRRPHL